MEKKVNFNEPDYPEKHDFDETPIVEGTLTQKEMLVIKDRDVHFIVLETEEGLRTIWLGAVLKSAMEERDPKIGDYIGIKYLGMKEATSGLSYRNFAVRIVGQ